MTKRGSRDGRDAKRSMGGPGAAPPGRVMTLNIPSTQVELHKTENAWKPGQMADKGKCIIMHAFFKKGYSDYHTFLLQAKIVEKRIL